MGTEMGTGPNPNLQPEELQPDRDGMDGSPERDTSGARGDDLPDFDSDVAHQAVEDVGLSPSLDVIRDILEGQTKWAEFIKSHPNLKDVMIGLKIAWKYHPANKGEDPKYPKCTLGDIDEMRQDLMHISALGVHLAGIAAALQAASEGLDAERRLAEASAWRELRKLQRAGKRAKMTVAEMEQEAHLLAMDRYRLKNETKIAGDILSWVRASLRNHAEALQVLIRSSMREERADARLH